MSSLSEVRGGLNSAGVPRELTTELLDAFSEAKRRYFASDMRPNSIEGGRFSEAAFRVLQWQTEGNYTSLGRPLPSVDKMMDILLNRTGSDSVRVHIPRTLRLIYDIRNKRDIAHLADGIDPNMQDATLVVRNMEWILAEFVRMYHKVSPSEAQCLIEDLVSKELPAIQEIDGFPRVLKTLRAADYCLLLLYWCGPAGATIDQLREWVRPEMRSNLRRTLAGLEKNNYIHIAGQHHRVLLPGEKAVEEGELVQPN